MQAHLRELLILLLFVAATSLLHAQWSGVRVFPAGGVVNSLAADSNSIVGTKVYVGLYKYSRVAQDTTIYLTTDGGANWLPVAYGQTIWDVDCMQAFPDGQGGTSLFVGTPEALFHTSDDGRHWVENETPAEMNPVVALTSSGPFLFAASIRSGVYRSSNQGASWTPISVGLTDSSAGCVVAKGATLFAGTPGNGVFRSTDYGAHWVQTGLSAYWSQRGLSGGHVWDLALYQPGSAEEQLLTATGCGLFSSSDQGDTWTRVKGVPRYDIYPDAPLVLYSVLVSGKNIFVGGDDYVVYLSQDAGNTWKWPLMIDDNSQPSLLVAGSTLYVGSWQTVRWVPMTVLTGVASSVPPAAGAFILEQNYPNPFNPSTTISYMLPHRTHVTLTVFNTLGQKVAELVSGEIDAGYHTVQFDASHLASGMYLYRIRAGSFVDVKKLVLTR